MIILLSLMVSVGQESKQNSDGQFWLQVTLMITVRHT